MSKTDTFILGKDKTKKERKRKEREREERKRERQKPPRHPRGKWSKARQAV